MKSLFLSLSAIVCLLASADGAPVQPGRYSDWRGVDQVTIVQPFELAKYKTVVVQPLETSKTPLPDAKDNSHAAVKDALAKSLGPFSEGMRQDMTSTALKVQSGGKGGADALVVRARVTKADPGSQAARYFAPGAGAAVVAITGQILDGRTNKVLVEFVQERRSGWGMFGGGYQALLHRNIKQIGGDVAGLLKGF